MKEILKEFDFELLSMTDVNLGDLEIPEEGETFEENSLHKARVVFELTGYASIADDSGLMVEYLNGAPGVHSARYAGEAKQDGDNNAKLLEALRNVPVADRGAKFVTVVTFYMDESNQIVARGEIEGSILEEPRGSGGFGYDPLFYVESYGKTFAELSGSEKNAISHRGRALRALKDKLQRFDEEVRVGENIFSHEGIKGVNP
jgi:XTP/dITP diphosphohydrolase